MALWMAGQITITGFTKRRCLHAKCGRQVYASNDFECTKRQLKRVVGDATNALLHAHKKKKCVATHLVKFSTQ